MNAMQMLPLERRLSLKNDRNGRALLRMEDSKEFDAPREYYATLAHSTSFNDIRSTMLQQSCSDAERHAVGFVWSGVLNYVRIPADTIAIEWHTSSNNQNPVLTSLWEHICLNHVTLSGCYAVLF